MERGGISPSNVYELARYPFMSDAERYLRSVGFTLEEAITDSVLKRSHERIELAIRRKEVNLDLSDSDVEIISFYIAMLVVRAVSSGWLTNVFARAEGERSRRAFMEESSYAICRIVNQLLGLNLRHVDRIPFVLNEIERLKIEFSASIFEYLKVNSELGQIDNPKLSLINNYLHNGIVYLTRDTVTDLVKDQFSFLIKKRISKIQVPVKLPESLASMVDEFRRRVPKPRNIPSQKKYGYVEEILRSDVQDGRHRILWLILPPYLVNVKHLPDEEAAEVIRSYIERIGWREPRADRLIRYNIKRARRIGLMPPTLDRLRQTHPDLYNIIMKSIGKEGV
ncbi:MAG: DNA primase noncatalytic subunit PriX [Conexivisphaerales archaeon]